MSLTSSIATLGYTLSQVFLGNAVNDEEYQQSDILLKEGDEFFAVNTVDFLISVIQMTALTYYFRAWRLLAKEKAIDKFISITFTCFAFAIFSRLLGTILKCVTNYVIWKDPLPMK